MKKTLILASMLALAFVPAFANEQATTTTTDKAVTSSSPAPQVNQDRQKMEQKRAEFEKRLKLTDKQKAQAKAIRQKGQEEIKPIMDKIQEKEQEINAVKRSKIAIEEQQARIAELDRQIRALKRHAHELRMKNMEEFEAILTKKQLKELKKMKEEGRKNFDKEFKKNHQNGHDFRPEPPRGEGPRPFGPPEPPMD